MEPFEAAVSLHLEFFAVIPSSLVEWTVFQHQEETRVQTDQERRTILAVGLSLLVYMVYLQWFAPPITTAIPADEAAGTLVEAAQEDATDPVGVPASEAPDAATASEADSSVESVESDRKSVV